MSQQKIVSPKSPDPELVAATLQRVAEQSQRIVEDFVRRQSDAGGRPFQVLDPEVVGRSFGELYSQVLADPERFIDAQIRFWQDTAKLWQATTQRMLGEAGEAVIEPAAGDRRFKDEAWVENPVFDYIKQSYLLAARYLHECADDQQRLSAHESKKIEFYTRQFVDAMAPTNFAGSNPLVLRETLESGGENLLKGLNNLLGDLERGKGKLKISMTDEDKFELGVNVAVTPGKVVFENELMQLIQYTPATDKVHKTPLMIIPPWINKFYILDLRDKNSFIKWAVAQGHTVFVLSWVNPDEQLAEKGFEDYMLEGPLAALEVIEQITGEKKLNAVGYCLGGTLLAATLAWMRAQGDKRIRSATFLATMVDFSEPGELGVFIDEEQLSLIEKDMQEKGYFEGANMAEAFNLLRANDLIWSFVVNNYLLGRDPFPFDLLYWNSDSTRMPRNMHSFYLRNMYQQNLLRQPGGLSLCGTPVDLGAVDAPVYILATHDDHIAPWKSTYAATGLYAGTIRFVLGGSGHIAGVINPPSAHKYGYWTNPELADDPDTWLAGAEQQEGSWWSDWQAWVKPYTGKKVKARNPGDGPLNAIEEAPGRYVKNRLG